MGRTMAPPAMSRPMARARMRVTMGGRMTAARGGRVCSLGGPSVPAAATRRGRSGPLRRASLRDLALGAVGGEALLDGDLELLRRLAVVIEVGKGQARQG